LAFGGPATPLTVCELATGKRLHELAPPQGIISGLAFTPNGRFLAVDEYSRIRLFGVVSGKEMRKLPVTTGTRNQLVFSPDGRTLAAVGGYTINLWDMASQRRLHPPGGHEAGLQSMAFFPNGKRLVSADYDHGMIVWDIASGRSLAQRKNNTYAASLTVEGDGETVRYAGYDVAVHRWNLRTLRDERQAMSTGQSTNMVAMSPDGRSMAVFTFDRQLRLYDVKNNKSIVLPGLPRQCRVIEIAFAPDSRRLAAISNNGDVCLWEADKGKLLREFKTEPLGGQPIFLSFASDGRSLAFFDGRVRIREIASGAGRLQIPRLSDTVFVLAYSPDARFLAYA
ncbi:MAG: WD40 repeat domain-containing protein, partial [Gemmataceae bacterium]